MNHLVPKDAEYVRSLVTSAYELSRSDCGNAHILAPMAIAGAAALSALNSLTYLYNGVSSLACFEIDLALDNFAAIGDSLGLLVVAVCLFVFGILFPEWAFECFKPDAPPLPVLPRTPTPPPHTPTPPPLNPTPVGLPLPLPEPASPPMQYGEVSEARMRESLGIAGARVDSLPGTERPSTWFESLKQQFVDPNHPSKLMKYRHWMNELAQQCPGIDQEIHHYLLQEDVLSKAYVALLKIIRDSKGEGYQDARSQYQLFVRKLDDLVSMPAYAGEVRIKAFVQKICMARWLSISMTRYYGEILQMTREAAQQVPRAVPRDFIEAVTSANQEVHDAPNCVKKEKPALYLQMASASLGVKYLTGDENTPNLRSVQTWKKDDEFQVILSSRYGCPTTAGTMVRSLAGIGLRAVSGGYFNCSTGEAVAPNYSEMVRAMSAMGRSVFFTCLQRNVAEGVENEQPRVQALLDEQAKHDNFFVLVQAMEGDLYDRKGGFVGITKFADLGNALCQEFQRGERCVLPKIIQENGVADYCTNVLSPLCQAVHQIFFPGRTDITNIQEWQSFLLLCYLFQRWDLQFRLGALSGKPVGAKTNPCKDYLDRGGITAFIESMVIAHITGKLNDPDWMQTEMANVIGPAIAVKKKEVIKKRLQQAVPLFDIIRNAEVEALREYDFCGYKVAHDAPSVRERQEALPSLESVRTRHELLIYLKSLCLASGWAPKRYTAAEMQQFNPVGAVQRKSIERELRGFKIHFNGEERSLEQLIADCGSEERALYILHFALSRFATEALAYVTATFRNDDQELRCRTKQAENIIDIRSTQNGHLLELTNDLEFIQRDTRVCDIRTKSIVEFGASQIAGAWNFAITNLAAE